MSPSQIKTALQEQGYSMTMIAVVLEKSPSLVSKVINGRARSMKVAKAISKVLEKNLTEVFPGQYPSSAASDFKNSNDYHLRLKALERLLK